jgi:2-oxoglutarate ferredoxin oxidoreductase subunit gamma
MSEVRPGRTEVRLAGAGSHGMIEAGLILQEAAAIYDDLNAHHVQSYGPEARSQHARSEVIISGGEIDYPRTTEVDALVVTTQEAFDFYCHDLKPAALVIADADVRVSEPGARRLFRLPLVATAEGELKKPGLLHLIALGALAELSRAVSRPALEAAVKDRVPRGGEDAPLAALEAGYRLAKAARSA